MRQLQKKECYSLGRELVDYIDSHEEEIPIENIMELFESLHVSSEKLADCLLEKDDDVEASLTPFKDDYIICVNKPVENLDEYIKKAIAEKRIRGITDGWDVSYVIFRS